MSKQVSHQAQLSNFRNPSLVPVINLDLHKNSKKYNFGNIEIRNEPRSEILPRDGRGRDFEGSLNFLIFENLELKRLWFYSLKIGSK